MYFSQQYSAGVPQQGGASSGYAPANAYQQPAQQQQPQAQFNNAFQQSQAYAQQPQSYSTAFPQTFGTSQPAFPQQQQTQQTSNFTSLPSPYAQQSSLFSQFYNPAASATPQSPATMVSNRNTPYNQAAQLKPTPLPNPALQTSPPLQPPLAQLKPLIQQQQQMLQAQQMFALKAQQAQALQQQQQAQVLQQQQLFAAAARQQQALAQTRSSLQQVCITSFSFLFSALFYLTASSAISSHPPPISLTCYTAYRRTH